MQYKFQSDCLLDETDISEIFVIWYYLENLGKGS